MQDKNINKQLGEAGTAAISIGSALLFGDDKKYVEQKLNKFQRTLKKLNRGR